MKNEKLQSRPARTAPTPIAVVGMSVRVPGANSLGQFWDNLIEGRDTLTRPERTTLEKAGVTPSSLAEPLVVASKPVIPDIEYFDAKFFGIPESQARLTDPAHRLFLQCAWEAMEDAGLVPGDHQRATGVFAGVEGNYLQKNLELGQTGDPATGIALRLGNASDYFSLRVSHALNLVGPSYTAKATCSTSLLSVHLATQSLRSGECDAAIAGGATINVPNIALYRAGVDGMLSTSGRVRPFDAGADGTVFGNGLGAVVLKRLEDAIREGNPIYGVIKGTAYCNDGQPDDKVSFIAPTPSGQKRAISKALEESGVDPGSLGLVECHGTGTLLGDPTEITSLTEVYRQYTSDNGFCAIGSLKGNIGHLGAAAGVLSLIKTCLSLHRGVIPPMANFEAPNPAIDLENSPFYINTSAMPWNSKGSPKRAGVSAFGFGGANAHVVLEESPARHQATPEPDPARHLIVISARDEAALQRRKLDLAAWIETYPHLRPGDVAHTLQSGRQAMPYRYSVVANERLANGLATQLRTPVTGPGRPCKRRPVVFLFPGQGSQEPGMGRGLYDHELVYRETFDYCTDFLEGELGFSLRDKIFPDDRKPLKQAQEELKQTTVAQPALFVVEYALAKVYEQWGLTPSAMLGHSVGELVAACLAGVFSLEDGLRIVAVRGRLMQRCDPGSMLAVLLPVSRLLEILPDDLDLASENAPTSNVVSGPAAAVKRFATELDSQGIGNRMLATSHAFHSRLMEKTIPEYADAIRSYEFRSPDVPVISNVTGLPLTGEEASDCGYWARQVRQTVRFSKGLQHFLGGDGPLFMEVGPGNALSSFVEQHDPALDSIRTMFRPVGEARRNAHEIACGALGEAWCLGAHVDWSRMYAPGSVRRVRLPTYPFQQLYYWKKGDTDADELRPRYPLNLYEPGWERRPLDDDSIVPGSDWLVFSDNRGFADETVQTLRQAGGNVSVVEMGDRFTRFSEGLYEVRPGSRTDITTVLDSLALDKEQRLRILHFWTLTDYDSPKGDLEAFDEYARRGFHTIVALIQAAYSRGLATRLDIQIYTDGLDQVDDLKDEVQPAKASLLGPCMVAPQEIPGLTIRCIDVLMHDGTHISNFLRDAIVREAGCDVAATVTALRADGRYVQNLYELPEIPLGNPGLRHGGTVLITGGVGGLGPKIAEHLYRTRRAKLVLTSRWAAPPFSEWEHHLESEGKKARALGALTDLVKDGAQLMVVQADASSPTDMENVVDQARERFGDIHGVVHAAGLLDDGPLLQKTSSSADKVFTAKVKSAFVLDQLFQGRSLDMFVYFSSQASARPTKGQVDYASANAVLDRLAMRRKANGAGMVCAVGWGPWRDAGMAWDYDDSAAGLRSVFEKITGKPRSETLYGLEHPVLRGYRKLDGGDIVFEGSLERGGHWTAQDHVIEGYPVLSGTTMMEMMHRGFLELHPSAKAVEIGKLVIYRPFAIREKVQYEMALVKDGDAVKVEIRARDRKVRFDWMLIASAVVREIDGRPRNDSTLWQKLQAVRASPLKHFADELRPDVAAEVEKHGPRWHCDVRIKEDEDCVTAKVRLKDDYHCELDEFGLHPAILDRSIHTVTEHFRGIALPHTCESIRLYGRVPAETLVTAQVAETEGGDGINLVVLNMAGEPIVEMEDYVQRHYQQRLMSEWGISNLDGATREHRIMKLGKPGVLDSFSSRTFRTPALQEGQVRIDVRAAGLNFRDVLAALGQLPEGDPSRNMMGSECSGIVSEVGPDVKHVRPGDRVVAMASSCFATSVVANAHSVTYLPESLGYAEGASIPIAYLTVDYALNHLAGLSKGERVLIHAATGGIGLAAVQLARKIGAEIYATAGSHAKREYLKHLGITHVMDSRNLDFVDEVKAWTDGKGVDVVLNSLAGEYVHASMNLLRPFGRFLELGKRDIYADSKLGLYPFRNNISYFGIDLGQLGQFRRDFLKKLFDGLMTKFATGELKPGPVNEYSIADISKGFEFMARSSHIGKIVFLIDDEGDPRALKLEKFRSRFGEGIAVRDGLAAFDRLLSSDRTPSRVTATALPLTGSDTRTRHVHVPALTRSVNTPFREPRNTNEEVLQQIWEKTLGLSPIGVDDDFRELGGDSLNAIMIQIAVKETFSVEVSLSSLFRYPTISKLSGRILKEAGASG